MNLGEFEEWLTRIENIADPSKYLNFNAWAQRKREPEGSRHEFAKYVCGLFETVDKAFDSRVEISQVETEIVITPDTPNSDFMSYLTLSTIITHPISLESTKIKKLEMIDIITDVNLLNVSIAHLYIISCPSATFYLNNCFIANLVLQGNCVRNFYVAGGAILNIQCPPPRSENPFNGSVHFDKKVYLPRRSGRLLRGAQPYRNMRAHMAALENAPMVSRFHQLEQSVERENLGGIDRFLSFGYKLLSNYGSSSGKPLVWLLSLLLVTFFFALFDGGSVPGEITGWQTSLQGEQCQARIERAVSLALQATLNPLGIFGTKSVVVAQSGGLACWLFVHGVFSALFIALLILAVRRRFKVG